MSVLIKGMEMPEAWAQLFVYADGTVHQVTDHGAEVYHAVHLPPSHGRLIDADALDKQIYNDIPLKVFGNIARMTEMRSIVYHAPTIIEAEDGLQ